MVHLAGFPADDETQKILAGAGILIFPTHEEAVRAMYALVTYGKIRRQFDKEQTS